MFTTQEFIRLLHSVKPLMRPYLLVRCQTKLPIFTSDLSEVLSLFHPPHRIQLLHFNVLRPTQMFGVVYVLEQLPLQDRLTALTYFLNMTPLPCNWTWHTIRAIVTMFDSGLRGDVVTLLVDHLPNPLQWSSDFQQDTELDQWLLSELYNYFDSCSQKILITLKKEGHQEAALTPTHESPTIAIVLTAQNTDIDWVIV